jgi:hypothetical protein
MTTSTCPHRIPLVRPLHERLLDTLADGWQRLRVSWQARAEVRRQTRELNAMADMNELLLRDIGAPEWLIAEAQVRRDTELQRLFELNHGLQRHD